MPWYVYKDHAGHQIDLEHRMLYTTGVICACGLPMHRVIQPARINWNGNQAGREPSPAVQQLLATVPQRRDAFAKEKDYYDRHTIQAEPSITRKPSHA